MFFRPLAQSVFPSHPSRKRMCPPEWLTTGRHAAPGEPVVALLDGMPLEHHELLEGRLTDRRRGDFASLYRPGQQQHGTAMASLIAHGDSGRRASQLRRPIYVRPILRPYENLEQSCCTRRHPKIASWSM